MSGQKVRVGPPEPASSWKPGLPRRYQKLDEQDVPELGFQSSEKRRNALLKRKELEKSGHLDQIPASMLDSALLHILAAEEEGKLREEEEAGRRREAEQKEQEEMEQAEKEREARRAAEQRAQRQKERAARMGLPEEEDTGYRSDDPPPPGVDQPPAQFKEPDEPSTTTLLSPNGKIITPPLPLTDQTFLPKVEFQDRYRPLSPTSSYVQQNLDGQFSHLRKTKVMKTLISENDMLLDVISTYENRALEVEAEREERRKAEDRRKAGSEEDAGSTTTCSSEPELAPPPPEARGALQAAVPEQDSSMTGNSPMDVLAMRRKKREQLWRSRTGGQPEEANSPSASPADLGPSLHLDLHSKDRSLREVRATLQELRGQQKFQEEKLLTEMESPPEQVLVIDEDRMPDSPTRSIHLSQMRARNMLTHGTNMLKVLGNENEQLENVVRDFDSLLRQKKGHSSRPAEAAAWDGGAGEAVLNPPTNGKSYFPVSQGQPRRPGTSAADGSGGDALNSMNNALSSALSNSPILKTMPYQSMELRPKTAPVPRSALGILGKPLPSIKGPKASLLTGQMSLPCP